MDIGTTDISKLVAKMSEIIFSKVYMKLSEKLSQKNYMKNNFVN